MECKVTAPALTTDIRTPLTVALGLLGDDLQGHLTMYLLQKRGPVPCAGIIRTHPVALQRFSTLESH